MDILYLTYGSNNAGPLANHIQSISMLESQRFRLKTKCPTRKRIVRRIPRNVR